MKNVLGATTIEQLVGASGDDRRGKKRFVAADIPIAVAPYATVPLPSADVLCPVECRNISRQGIAFVWSDKPPGRFMLIRLGRPPEAYYLTARVVGIDRTSVSAQHIVRCQFVREVELDSVNGRPTIDQ